VLVEVGRASSIPEGEARRFTANGTYVAVVNLGNGLFLGVDDICSHAESSLSEGEVDLDDETVECPRHGSVFDLRSGRPRSLPATLPVRAFPVKVEGDAILIEVED
jgi:3-phenylpropionate/trans-cinnamate dioxygenase ferredoxin subunit